MIYIPSLQDRIDAPIYEWVSKIDQRVFALPHMQRPFVWKKDQIRLLLDSIMRGYPIGEMLVWNTKCRLVRRFFIKSYDSKEEPLKFEYDKQPSDDIKYLVLDGQQRLQSLYFSLLGTYDGQSIYFDILSGTKPDENGILYSFYFSDEKNPLHKPTWLLLRDLIYADEENYVIRKRAISQLESVGIPPSEKDKELIERNIDKLRKVFREDKVLRAYVVRDTLDENGNVDIDRILEIFIRANSGGTVLSKSDLLFSILKVDWLESEQIFTDLLKDMNSKVDVGFDKDFLIKTCLTLIGTGAKYSADKFRGQNKKNLEAIKAEWPKITTSVGWTVDFLRENSLASKDALPSNNAIIPMIYYAYVKDCKINEKEKRIIFVWLCITLLNRHFSGNPDNLIDKCTELINQNKEIFPKSEIEEFVRTDMKRATGIQFDILNKKSKSATMSKKLILNLLYHRRAVIDFQPLYSGNKPNIEHIFPKSLLHGRFEEELIWDIGNLRYLGRDENLSKLNEPPRSYLSTLDKSKLSVHLIPDSEKLWDLENYPLFLIERKKLISIRLEEVLKL